MLNKFARFTQYVTPAADHQMYCIARDPLCMPQLVNDIDDHHLSYAQKLRKHIEFNLCNAAMQADAEDPTLICIY